MNNYFEKSEPPPPPLKDWVDQQAKSFCLNGDSRNGVPGTPLMDPETGEYIGRWASQKRADEIYELYGDIL